MSRRFMLVLTALAALAMVGCIDDGGGSGQAPLVDATASPEEGPAPLTVDFTVDARWSNGSSGDFSFTWDFGDGEVSTEQDPSHKYREEGTYQVSVTASDKEGEADGADQLTIEVGAASGDVAAADEEPSASADGEMVPFDDWAMDVNDACAASATASAGVQPDPATGTLTDEQFGELAAITRDESTAVEAAGLPAERTDEARVWLDLRSETVEVFLGIVENPPVDPSNPDFATLEQKAGDLVVQSQALGLSDCAGD